MSKLRVFTLVPLLTVAVLLACTPSATSDIESIVSSDVSVEDAAAATVKAMSIEGAVQATLEAMAPDATETPTPQPIGQAPTPDNQSVSNPTVVIEIAATSAVTESASLVTPTVVIEVPEPTSTVTSVSVSSLSTPVVQVATPTSIVSASIETVTATAAVIPTIVPSPVAVPTPIPEPTATPTPTPIPLNYNIIEGTTPIGTSGYNYTLQGFSVEDYDLISDLISTQIKWGDSNDYQQVSVMQGTGEILANHTFTSGGAFYGEIRLVSISTGEVLASQTITIVMNLGDIPTAVPTISVIDVATPTATVSAGVTPTATAAVVVVQPTSTPTCDMSGWINIKVIERVNENTPRYDEHSVPIVGANVQITGDLQETGTTDDDGNFTFSVCSGSGGYEIEITASHPDADDGNGYQVYRNVVAFDGFRPLFAVKKNGTSGISFGDPSEVPVWTPLSGPS